jgi:hypothetical protein
VVLSSEAVPNPFPIGAELFSQQYRTRGGGVRILDCRSDVVRG